MTTCIVVATYYLSREGLPVDLIDGIINRVTPRPIILEKMHPFLQIFITKIIKNKNYQNKLVTTTEFFRTHHSIHNRPKCIEIGGCDDCYSGDTEYDHLNDVMSALGPIIEKSNNEYNEQYRVDDSEDGEESWDE